MMKFLLDRIKTMMGWDAMKIAAGRNTTRIANDLRVSPSIVGKWQEPHGAPKDSGSRSPVETTRDFMVSAMRNGTPHEDGIAPLLWLAWEMGYTCIPLPERSEAKIRDLSEQLMRVVKEFGHVCQVFSEKIASDGEVSAKDAREMEHEIRHLVIQALTLQQKIQEAVR